MRRVQRKREGDPTPGDPQHRYLSPGDPQHRYLSPGDPQNLDLTSGDSQLRYQTHGYPQHSGLEVVEPQYRYQAHGNSQFKSLEVSNPQHRNQVQNNPQHRNQLQNNPQHRNQLHNNPQHRSLDVNEYRSPALSDSQPSYHIHSDPQYRAAPPGDLQDMDQHPRQTPDPQLRSKPPPEQQHKNQPRSSPQHRDPQRADSQRRKPPNDPGYKSPGDLPQSLVDPLQTVLLGVGRPLLRVVLCLLPVYVCGRLGLSLTWVLFGLFLWMFWDRNKSSKLARLRAAWDLMDNESLEVTRGLNNQQLPAWVNFPDVERVEWINKVLKQMWPYFGMYVEKLLHEKVEPLVRSTNVHLSAFTFTKVSFGDKPPRINGVKAYTKKVDKREVILDIQLSYSGDCEVNIEVKKVCKAGVKGIQLHGTLRVILAPLLPNVPFIGAVTMFFLHKPHLEINWTGLTNILEIPGVSDMSDTMIIEMIASHLVLPNRLTFPLVGNVNAAQLRFPVPHGVLRIYLIEARNLIPKDTYLRGIIKGKSDPYAVLKVGTQCFKSKTIKENLNPKWNEFYEFVIHEVPGQDLEVDLFDEDPDKDDFLGSMVVNLEGVMRDRVVQEWFPLCDVVSGMVHMKLEWLSLLANHEKLFEADNMRSTAMVIVYLDCASNLPKNHLEYSNNEYAARRNRSTSSQKPDKDPSSYVFMCVGSKRVKSKTRANTKDPVWEQAFAFFIKDVYKEHLYLEIKDDDRQCILGMLDIPLQKILGAEDLTLDQRFQLTNSGPNSSITMKIVLRVLYVEEPEPDTIYAGINSLKHIPVSIKREHHEKPPKHSNENAPKHSNQTHSQHTVPQSKVIRKDSTAGDSVQPLNHIDGESRAQKSHSDRIPSKGSAPRTPNLRALHRLAPSLISLNSVASSVFDLTDGGSGEVSGEISITVRYASLRRCLIVEVNSCRNLIQCSNNGADPYVRIYLLPDRRWSSRKKTTVKKKTLNPQYNERFEFLVPIEDAKKRILDIAVKHNRSFGSHERKELGKVLLDLSNEDVAQGFSQWYELTPSGHPSS
ncbi:extended synaptotagmin-3 [Bombina bombina]|uniref:extended synaptotagmin-3 n=1 Tax=Bombina bombina TaxID=8345 RepID=UPI00235A5435|nr:extended synaptotagmin-3 [Bombina bombina]